MKRLFLIPFVLLLTSCATSTVSLQNMSSGKIGCSPQEIEINNSKNDPWSGQSTWESTCKGTKYICSAITTGRSRDISCTEAK